MTRLDRFRQDTAFLARRAIADVSNLWIRSLLDGGPILIIVAGYLGVPMATDFRHS